VGPWLEKLELPTREQKIVRNIRVCHAKTFDLPGEVEDAWRVVNGECVFDMTYMGSIFGPALGTRYANAVRFAVAYLRRYELDPTQSKSLAWQAAQAATDDDQYDGRLHLSAATEMAATNAQASFAHLATAVYFSAATNSRLIQQALAQALDLAQSNGWHELSAVLDWAAQSGRG
jgi:hypothetical protein